MLAILVQVSHALTKIAGMYQRGDASTIPAWCHNALT